jgi:hypothetical protein
MNWTHLLGWGSPIGLGAFFIGLGALLKGLMHGKMYGKHGWHEK